MIGPSYRDFAGKYADDANAAETIAQHVKQGSSGIWGPIPMPPNPGISDEDLAKVNSMGYTLDQALTLASIIQSEASDPENMPMVSSVFANRLKPGSGFGYLGSDVTRHYIEREMKAYIEEQGMDYDALFGAYCTNDGYSLKTTGLPAGPICNMGKAAIEAALNPAESKYYYFFTDNDWNYYYNETLSGHQSQWNQLIAEGKAGGTATTTAKQ